MNEELITMAAKLTPNMIKSLENLAKAGTVPADDGTLAMNKLGCTANGLEALERRNLIERFETGEEYTLFNGRPFHPRAYRLTEAGEAKIVELNSNTEITAETIQDRFAKVTADAKEARKTIAHALILGGVDPRTAQELIQVIDDAAWSAGYDAGHKNGKAQYSH
jgi:hypothetical protein